LTLVLFQKHDIASYSNDERDVSNGKPRMPSPARLVNPTELLGYDLSRETVVDPS
jgi:hypothetical protein